MAVETLEQGKLVVLPTETVYGIAARADSTEALERLANAKGRPVEQALTWHVSSSACLDAFPRMTQCVRRLAERYWPGPLTLVLPGTPEGLALAGGDDWTGVRCTAGEFSNALCAAVPFPVVMTSANPHGQEAARTPGDWSNLKLDDDDLVCEHQGRELPGASTVLRIGRGRFELLREGLVDLDTLRRTAGMRIAFACTGNTCRSPMAEGLARHAIAKRLECKPAEIESFGFEVSSMGIYAAIGAGAAEHAIDTLRDMDIDISGHSASQAIPERVADLDAVFCLTGSHLAALEQMLPPSKCGHLHLLDPDGRDIPDPIGGSSAVYRECAARIETCIERRLSSWV